MTHVLIPGTFDPPTLGHMDLVQRARRMFERVTVGVATHPTKSSLFTSDERVAMLSACFAESSESDLADVQAVALPGLVIDGCERFECDAIVRGVRSGTDYDYEAQMAATNRALLTRIDTMLLVTSPAYAHITSTLVRQVASMGGDASVLVPGPVAAALRAHFGD